MYEQETIKPYHVGEEKAKQVEEMFDNIAPTYDKLNHRLSWDIDRLWRKKAIRRLELFHPETMLDIATGTGDFAILATEMLHPRKLIGADISEGMMEVGRRKVAEKGLQDIISFAKEDCLAIRIESNSVSTTGRSTQGVRLINIKDDNTVAAVSVIKAEVEYEIEESS